MHKEIPEGSGALQKNVWKERWSSQCYTKKVTGVICLIQDTTEVSPEECLQDKVYYNTLLSMKKQFHHLDLMIQML